MIFDWSVPPVALTACAATWPTSSLGHVGVDVRGVPPYFAMYSCTIFLLCALS